MVNVFRFLGVSAEVTPYAGKGSRDGGGADTSTFITRRAALAAALLALLVQQGAFVSSPVLGLLLVGPGSVDNELNTVAVALNIIVLTPLCVLRRKEVGVVLYDNKLALGLVALLFASISWSIHPDVTFRRDLNYLSTGFTIVFMVAEFDVDDIMKIFSYAFAISAVSSFLFVVLFPADAVHQPSQWQGEELTGAWKGVFPHKNVLGHAMTVGVFAALYNLSTPGSRKLLQIILLAACLALMIMARSATALSVALIYIILASVYFVLLNARRYFAISLVIAVATASAGAFTYLALSDQVDTILGGDLTLTGRTPLWELVLRVIHEKPLLGQGYGAMWLPNDNTAIAISNAVGWVVPQAHNAFLEITLELGCVGLTIVVLFILLSIWRGILCCVYGSQRLGIFALIAFIGVLVSGATESVLAQNQNIEWVTFNVMSFCCGQEILRKRIVAPN